MSERQETVDDIIAEKRRRADEIERDCAEKMKRGEMVSDCYARELVADIRREADRLEAAHKRERGDCAKLLKTVDLRFDICRNIELVLKIGRDYQNKDGYSGAHYDTVKLLCDAIEYQQEQLKTKTEVGNCAKLREAASYLTSIFDCDIQFLERHAKELRDTGAYGGGIIEHILHSITLARAALAAPPRNCDLPEVAKGQPKLAEQAWRVFKRSHKDSHLDSYGLLRCIRLLLAPATEKEGGAK